MGILAGTGLLLAAAIAERKTGERRRAAGLRSAKSCPRQPLGRRIAILKGDLRRARLEICGCGLSIEGAAAEMPRDLAGSARASHFEPRRGNRPSARCRSSRPGLGVGCVHLDRKRRSRTPTFRGPRSPTGRDPWRLCVPDLPRSGSARRDRVFPADRRAARPGSAADTVDGRDQLGQFVARAAGEPGWRRNATANSCCFVKRPREAKPRPRTARKTNSSPRCRTSCARRSTPSSAGAACCCDGTLDPKKRRALEVIDRNARCRPSSSTTSSTCRASSPGKLRLETRPVDLAAVVGAALDAVTPGRRGQGHRRHLDRRVDERRAGVRATRSACSRSSGTCSRTR